MVHHRHKQRILTTIVSLITFVICADFFLLLRGSPETKLLLTFGLAMILLTLYHWYNYRHCHEHITMINNLTQIYLALVVIVSMILIFILRAIFSLNTFIWFSVIVVVLTLSTQNHLDAFLENHILKRFPMAVPAKKRVVRK